MIAIINYNSGNIASVCNALDRIGQEFVVTSDASVILGAGGVIFPGVGSANAAMKDLCEKGLDSVICKIKVPFLGICLGLQLMGEFSEERDTKCLGIINEKVKKFEDTVKVPQIGWNKVWGVENSLMDGIEDGSYFYFVNSYYLPLSDYTLGKTLYFLEFSSVIQKDNFYATQFHPEKSGKAGEKLLSNFCKLC